jgi:hypothetical protein
MAASVCRYSAWTKRWTTKNFWLHFWQNKVSFPFSKESRPALGPTQPPVQWVQGALPPGLKWQGIQSNHSLPRLLQGGAATPLPRVASRHAVG